MLVKRLGSADIQKEIQWKGCNMKKAFVFIFSALLAAGVYAQTKTPITGFGGVSWGASMADVKKGIKGKIIFDDEKKLIVSRDGEITYRYGFFYKEPAVEQGKTADAAKAKPATDKNPVPSTSRFFYSISEFPYLSLDKIREKLTAQYGEPTGDNIKKNQGALVWDSGSGAAIVWVDAYEKKSFCRKISYISKDIAKELNTYQDEVFSQKERDVIKNLIP